MLTVHRAERAGDLVAALAGVLAEPVGDPFTPEIVAVPSRGIERWLAQRLSNVLGAAAGRADGVCANVEFPFPGRLVGTALRAVTGIDPDADPWAPARAAWPLLAVIDEHLDDAWMSTLSTHLGGSTAAADDPRRTRRLGTARRVADLFDRYGFHRPAMIEAWAAGLDVDGTGAPLPPDLAWQAALWRRLRERLAIPSPAERLGPACATLRAAPDLVDLPPRISLYGLTRLAAGDLMVLDAVGATRDVHLFLLHPSPAWWDRELVTPGSPVGSPLLATWGKDARSMQAALAAHAAEHHDEHHGRTIEPDTLLHRLQADVHADARPAGRPLPGAGDERLVLAPGDHSVAVHSCYGRARQVEVLRDAIAHLLADDPTLEPRDVIVMCPDIETFAPLVQATFGSADATTDDGGPDQLQVRLADRALRQTNPVLAALDALLELATTRISASQLVDFAGLEPVRRRFRLDDDELARIEDWTRVAGVRWGLDAAHRAPFQLDRLATNTWQAGLDRLLLGVSMTEDELPLVGGVLPLDDVDSGDIGLAGRLAELVDRVRHAVDALSRPQPLAVWVAAIAESADTLTATTSREPWQRRELDHLLADLLAEAGEAADAPGPATELSLAEARQLLGDRLRGRPSRANFRTGHLTVCTLVPMRSVPHRVVCLLGLDDGSFPRHGGPDGDDVLERAPAPGDRDVRSEDRQLLLDALLAAGDHLVVTYGGHDERTNAARQPSVPIGELLDVIDATAVTAAGRARDQVVVEHPLQPFDARNFEPDALVAGRTWSFDARAVEGARARRTTRVVAGPFLPAPLAGIDATLVDLDDLVRFVQHPTRAFLRRRLGVNLTDDDDELADAIPIELDALERWGVGDRLLAASLAGIDPDGAVAAEQARGLLPPLALGQHVVDDLWPLVDAIRAQVTSTIGATEPRTVDVRVDLGPVGVVAGSVSGVHGSTLLSATYATVAPKHRLAAWVRLLALTAAHPGETFDAITIGRAGKRPGVARLHPVTPDAAAEHLGVLVDLYRRGMREPLPLYSRTSELLARRPAAAPNEWETSDPTFAKEDREPEHRLRFGRTVPFADVLAELPQPDDAGPGWDGTSTSRADRYAHRLWDGLLEAEERSWSW